MAQQFLTGVKITAGDENTLYLNTGSTGQETAIFYQVNGSYKFEQRVGTNWELYNYTTSNWDFHLQGSTGYLALGHNSPGAGLHVKGTTNLASRFIFTKDLSTDKILFGGADHDNFDTFVGSSSNHSFTITQNGAAAITVDTSKHSTFAGNVTLSSTGPLLHLANTTSTTGKTWRFSSAANGKFYITQEGVVDAVTLDHTTGNATFAGGVTVEGGTLELGKADTSSGHINAKELMTFNIDTDNDDTNRYFAWYKNSSSGSGTELVRIKEDGTVGIGTDDPAFNLEVFSAANSTTAIGIGNSGTAASRLYLDASNGDYSGSDYMWIGQNNDLSGEIFMAQNAGSFKIKTQPGGVSTTQFEIAQNGNATFTGKISSKHIKYCNKSISNSYERIYFAAANTSQLATAVRLTGTTHGSSHVANFTADILVNHYQDVFITSKSGAYTQVTLKVSSNNNGDYTLFVKSASSSASTYYFKIEAISDNVDLTTLPSSTASSNTTHEHTTVFGSNATGTGGTLEHKHGGKLGMSSGYASGKFAVMSNNVHGSYDFYNNGTSYFNGGVTIDASLNQTSGASSNFSGDITIKKPVDGDFTGLRIMNQKTYGSGTGINETARLVLGIAESGQADSNREGFVIETYTSTETDSSNINTEFKVRDGGAIGTAVKFHGNDKSVQFYSHIKINSGKALRLYNAAGSGWAEMAFNESLNMLQIQRGLVASGDSSLNLGTSSVRWANIWVDNINGGTPVSGSGADNYLALWNGTGAIDHDTDFYVDSSTLYTNALRITSDNAFYRDTINSITGGESWNASNGWHRIIEISGGSGRGKCHFLIQTGGGSGTPCRVEAIVNTAWSNSNSTLTILHNSYPNFITDIRVVRNATTNKSYVDIKGSGEDYVDVTILPDGSTSAAIVNFTNVNSLPSNDTMEIHQTLTNMIMSMSSGQGSGNGYDGNAGTGQKPFQVKYDGSIFAEQGTFEGTIYTNQYLTHLDDGNTYLEFAGADNIKLVAGGKNYLHAHDNGNLYLYGNNSTALTLDGSQNATFANDILTDADSSADIGKTGTRWANLWVDNINGSTPVTGGPFLPLVAGSGYPLTGSLYFNNSVRSIVWPHTSGQSSSRSWAFIGEQGSYGKFELRRSDAADDTPDTTVLEFDLNGKATFANDVRLGSYTGANTGGGGQTAYGALSIFENSGTAALFLGVKDASYANRGWSFKATEVGVNSKLELIEHGLSGTRLTITSGGDVGIGYGSPGYKLEVAEDVDGTADLLRLRNSDSTYAQTWAFQSDTAKDLVITGSSGAGGFKVVPGSRGSTFTGNVTITGDLTVGGTNTILNTQTVEVEDNILQLNTTQGSPDTATATTSGISVYRGNGITQASLIFDDADDTWDLTNNFKVDGKIIPNAHIELPYGGELRTLDSNGAVRTIARANSNKLQYGWSYNGAVEFMGGGSYSPKITINTDGTTTFANAIDVNGSVTVQSGLAAYYSQATSATTTTTIASVNKTTYGAAFFDYVAYKGTNIRAGTITAVNDGTNVEYNETSTTSLGDTSDITFEVVIASTQMSLQATTTSSTWTIKTMVRAL